jgi:hypothetical protein
MSQNIESIIALSVIVVVSLVVRKNFYGQNGGKRKVKYLKK